MPRARRTLLNMLVGFYNPMITIRQPQFNPRPLYIQPKPKHHPHPHPHPHQPPIQTDVIEPPNELKAVFLLELSDGLLKARDNSCKTTIEYYWNNYSNEFSRCPIEDTKGDQTILESYLDKYYAAGYRNFIGFSQTNTLNKSLPWFNIHPDAIGISTVSGVRDLNYIPKNIYRTTNSTDIRITPIISLIKNKTIYYIYEDGLPNFELTNVDLKKMVTDGYITSVVSYKGVITLDNMKTFLSEAKPEDVIITYLVNNRNNFINCFSKGIYGDNRLQIKNIQYDINANEPNVPLDCQDILNEIYNIMTFDGIGSSILYRNGVKDLDANFYSDAIRVLNMLINIKSIEAVGSGTSHFGVIEFEPVTKTIAYNNSTIRQLKDGVFNPIYLYVEDPYVGTYEAIFTSKQQILQEIIPMNPSNISGKSIAFFELNNPNLIFDNILNYSFYWYCYQRPLYPKFPIINTDNTVEGNIRLLNQYYLLGYRIFLGFSRSTILEGVNDWFNNHPDTIAISCFSTSISPALLERKNTNVFRLEYNDTCIVDSILSEITENKYTKMYYIYSGNENASINLKKYLEKYTNSLSNISYIPYNIDEGDNYNVEKIQGFFDSNGTDEKSVAILYIFNEQNYFDLFNQGLKFAGKQYSILNESTPILKGDAIAELDNKLYYILTFSANSSKIWRDNASYLSKQFNTDTNSASFGDAMKMIQYLQRGKPTNSLGSHCGPVQFNDKGDRLFPSYLKLLYNGKTNSYDKSGIIMSDPLLGNFQADLTKSLM
jgi:hypothetical protein